MARLLIVDDEENIRELLGRYFTMNDHEVRVAANGNEALQLINAGNAFDIVITDWLMTKMDGLELLNAIKRLSPDTTVILMTAYGSIENAVEAMKGGAFDYLIKPLKLTHVQLVVGRALEVTRLRSQNRTLRDVVTDAPLLTTKSATFRDLLEKTRLAASSDATILLSGESGTGKNVLARQIHEWSSRRNRLFVTINCTNISEHLVESELFGHVQGAFTGATKNKLGRLEAAHGGTAFLDEISEVPLGLQTKLLRFLHEGCFERVGGVETMRVDARIICASNRDLSKECGEGHFRADLYYRLNVINLHCPPLRERPEDTLPLAQRFLTEATIKHRRPGLQFSEDVIRFFTLYTWPGNIRELRNVVERAVVLSRDTVITEDDLPDSIVDPQSSGARPAPADYSLEAMEKQHIRRVLLYAQTFEEAAGMLGITPATLWRKRKLYQLD